MSKTILVVEDDIFIAMDLMEQLALHGFKPVGPCVTVAGAMSTLKKQHCDAAVLDINLGKETSAPIALELRSNQIPFVVVSGYTMDQIPEEYGDVPKLTKPILSEKLCELLT